MDYTAIQSGDRSLEYSSYKTRITTTTPQEVLLGVLRLTINPKPLVQGLGLSFWSGFIGELPTCGRLRRSAFFRAAPSDGSFQLTF